RIVGNVGGRGQDAGAVLQFDQPLMFQDMQRAALVGGVVRQADDGAFGQVGDLGVLLRIEADRADTGIADRDDVIALRLDLVVEIGLVLEGVGVDFAALQRLVGLGVIVEDDGLDRQAFLGRLGGDDAPDILVLAA